MVRADVVALEQAYLLNRFSAYVPAGMLFALRRDVVPQEPGGALDPGRVQLRPDKRPRPLVLRVNEGDCLEVRFTNLLSPVAEEEGGLPRENGGRLPAHVGARPGSVPAQGLSAPEKVSVDQPRTRAASFHVTGLELVPVRPDDCPLDAACGGDGANVGLPGQQGAVFNPGTPQAVREAFDLGALAPPGRTVVTRWKAVRQGSYLAYSAGAPVGGEGDGGQLGLGLFASVNVEPAGSRWYRSQVTHDELRQVTGDASGGGPAMSKAGPHPYRNIDYDALGVVDGQAVPILGMLDAGNTIVHSDLNAIIVPEQPARPGPESPACDGAAFGSTCGAPFREFTVIFHDEIHAEQAFPELADETNPLHLIKDGMGINYGASSMGSLVMSTPGMKKNVGPAKGCPECRAEEFFLSSWANGDPALLLAYGDDGKPTRALYPDDPSNVHNSYLGDPVRFRNLHAGPKETHVFHLHAHQWMQDASDPNSTYLDSQTISPGATFSYDVEFGGSGNRNYTVGDSIFHCHLYPHFAQGMWELWRVHDAFVDGRPGLFHPDKAADAAHNDPGMMNLPDSEVPEGTAQPAIVPLPGAALAPMPTAEFRGYPFYIPGKPGHRPPQPPLDLDVLADGQEVVDGGLPRHVVTDGTLRQDLGEALGTGGEAAQVIAQRVALQNPEALATLAHQWANLQIEPLPAAGTEGETTAMAFHEGSLATATLDPVEVTDEPYPAWWRPAGMAEVPRPAWWHPGRAYRTDFAAVLPGQRPPAGPPLFHVNSRKPAPGAPYADPCPEGAPVRRYRAAYIQTELVYNKHGWFDPQGRIMVLENDIKDIIDPDRRTRLPEPLFFRANSGECILFNATNLMPSALNVDDFQIYTPTDTIGQHIHLVKFDVTSSDGSGNGFNYEDGTFSPQEVRERIFAWNRTVTSEAERLSPRTHPLFREGGDIFEAARIFPERYGALLDRGTCVPQIPGQSDAAYEEMLNREHPFCGAQRTTQRWWADPILNTASGKDNTLRTVFTHDHMGPSSHQQHGLYAGLVIEPANSVWARIGHRPTAQDMVAAQGGLDCGAADPARRPALCGQLIGGSDLAQPTGASLRAAADPIEGAVEPRPVLTLRDDGGPTATMANIIAPNCIGDSDSNPAQPKGGLNRPPPVQPGAAPPNPADKDGKDAAARRPCPPDRLTHDTRREFALAIQDFGIAYNTALEPINPEPRNGDSLLRDKTFLRFGQRHVATTPARPLAISSEDPGSQFFNYRHEPLALRLSAAEPDRAIGGWTYRQNPLRADLSTPCAPGDQDCLGDPANGFSTSVHARRDADLARAPLRAEVSPATRALLAATPAGARLDGVLAAVERWRRDFNCALYPADLMGEAEGCRPGIERLEPWRRFGDPATPILPAYEGDPVQIRLIQGAQEAQHIFTMNGVKWLRLPGDTGESTHNRGSGFVNAQPLGISEHFEFNLTVNPFRASQSDYLYFGSSVDQLWDGLWGVLRSFSELPADQRTTLPVATSQATGITFAPKDFLAKLRDIPPVPGRGTEPVERICAEGAPGATDHHRWYDVSVLRACDLYGACGSKAIRGLDYSTRFGIADEKAIVYVLEGEGACLNFQDCSRHESAFRFTPNATALARLRAQFAAGRPLEPMVLRAAAGQCLHVNLRNHLPPWLDDGPKMNAKGQPQEVPEARAYLNFLPMITDSFNINQFRMSSSVGLSPARVVGHPLWADGSNVGLNGAVMLPGNVDPSTLPDARRQQGTLLPPCTGDRRRDGANESRCKASMIWSATDFEFNETRNRPLEFGAVPLRSFGDVIKHPAHGLVGALVIGPEGSAVCPDNRFARRLDLADPDLARVPPGLSAEICRRDGSRYGDHVLVVQDAVNATRGGLPVGNLSGAEEPDDYGVKALNYKTEPLWARTGNDPSLSFGDRAAMDQSRLLSSALLAESAGGRCAAGIPPLPGRAHPCDPETPVLEARAGETLRLHFVHGGGHTRQQGLAVSGHAWNPYPWSDDSHVFDAGAGSSLRQGVFNGFGPMMGVSLELTAGGSGRVPLDYVIRSQASFLFDGGIWGLLRVTRPTPSSAPMQSTPAAPD